MKPVATLIVDGHPDDYMPGEMWASPVRIDGDLPMAQCTCTLGGRTRGEPHDARPLGVGDRVALAVECDCCDCACGPPHPFATATVTEIKFTMESDHLCESGYTLTVTDVEELA